MENITWAEVNTRAFHNQDPSTIKIAMKYWKEGNIEGIICMMSNGQTMGFVADNWYLLKKTGNYEKALLDSHVLIRTNYSNWSLNVLNFLFMQADIEILRKTGDPIPDQETFTLYRGVSGVGRKRRVSGISWTDSPNTAAWFANRFSGLNLKDPAVFKVTVPNESIMACCFDRQEREYLVRMPLPVKPKRLKIMPEAFLPRDKDISSFAA